MTSWTVRGGGRVGGRRATAVSGACAMCVRGAWCAREGGAEGLGVGGKCGCVVVKGRGNGDVVGIWGRGYKEEQGRTASTKYVEIMGGDHKCPVCQATFTRPQHVARHMRSRKSPPPWSAPPLHAHAFAPQTPATDPTNASIAAISSPVATSSRAM